ncbi:MAG: beta-galactosidase [Bacteroidales bacterium]|nr:beta-galactosidase [Bacteroidales bacterium]
MTAAAKTLFLISLIAVLASCQPDNIDLAGKWRFQIDRNDQGITQEWFSKPLSDEITLPGSMASNALGDDITMETKWTGSIRNPNWASDPNYAPYHDPDNVRFPYWLQPIKKYTGAAWYQKDVTIPKSWDGNPLKLFIERAHWETTVWFDDQKIGTQNSLGTPHEYILAKNVVPGKHQITICVDNRIKDVDVGWNSHSISDHTQSNWNGMVGELKISKESQIRLSNIRISTDINTKTITINGQVVKGQGSGLKAQVKGQGVRLKAQVKGQGVSASKSIDIEDGENEFEISLELSDTVLLWDEFDPNLYELELVVTSGGESDRVVEPFGFRQVEATPVGLIINNRRLFLRGTLECAIFPLTGYPSTDPEEWKRIFRAIKSHGLNHMRFHSWCPPEAAFIAADQMGIYLQVECSSWANSPTTRIGDGLPIDRFIWDESKDIIKNYGNHPSFIMMAYGNEPGGQNQKAFLTEFVTYWKKHDPRRLYTSAAGWPMLAVNDYHNTPKPRIQGWGEQLNSIINSQPPKTDYDWTSRMPPDGKTVVSHEIGQWCVYPNFNEIKKYTGVLKAKNFEIFQESLEANHMGNLADSFLMASGKLQALCYKADIEAALRTPHFGGFQLLDLHDFPGQGTALVGVLDPFWEQKGYISPLEFSHFCNSVVPLARLSKRVFTEGESIKIPVQVANFSQGDLNFKTGEFRLDYSFVDVHNVIVEQNSFDNQTIPMGNQHYLGTINHTFKKIGIPRKLTLEVSIDNYSNSWDIWVYPESSEITNELSDRISSTKLKLANEISAQTLSQLESGGSVLLSLGRGRVSKEWGGDVGVGFSSIFWNTAWTGGQKPHTLGILCNPKHPALAEFPTEYHSNWQWWDAMSHADAIKLNALPVELKPIVRIIDDWVTNRQLALIFEAKVGKGKIIISGVDLQTDMDNRSEARQLRQSLLHYMASNKFNPTVEISPEQLKEMVVR